MLFFLLGTGRQKLINKIYPLLAKYIILLVRHRQTKINLELNLLHKKL